MIESEKTASSFILTPSVETWPLDVSSSEERYLVEVGEERRFEVSSGVHQVIELLRDGSSTAEDIAHKLQGLGFENATPERILRLIRQVLIPRHIVEPPPGEEFEEQPARVKRSSFLRVKMPLVGPETLRPITGVLRYLFDRRVMIVTLMVALAAHLYFYAQIFPTFEWAAIELPLFQYALLLLAMNLAAIFHELGHATACRHYDCPHGKIGWGVYIFMLVLYTDVSPAWRLDRRQRAMVDFAGMYFELIAASLVLGTYLWTGNALLVYLFLLLNLSILTSLNPVLRQDGYWLVSDLAGQANLRDANLEMLRGWWDKLVGREAATAPSIPTRLRITIQIYSVLTVFFSIVFFYWIAGWIVAEVVPGVPLLLQQIAGSLRDQPADYLGTLVALLRLLMYSLFVFFIAIAAWNLVAAMGRWVRGVEDPAGRREVKV